MKGLRSIVALSRDSMRGVLPGKIEGKPPTVEWVNPRDIFVEEDYQRDLGAEASTALIRKIVGKWSWRKFKMPVCVRVPEFDDVLVAIDGQHTATGAATHPQIKLIPVMVVDAATAAERADSFVGHNRDRLALTSLAIHRGAVAASDELAVSIEEACKAAGARVLVRHSSQRDKLEVGATVAVGALRQVVKVQGQGFLERVLRVLVRAGRSPILADEITAVAQLLAAGRADDERLAAAIRSKTQAQWRALAVIQMAEGGGEKPAPALATVWHRAQRADGVPRPAPTVPPRTQSQVKPIPPKSVLRQPDPEPDEDQPQRGAMKSRFDIGAPGQVDRLTEIALDRKQSRDLLAEAAANTRRIQESMKKAGKLE